MGAYHQVKLGVPCLLRVYIGVCFQMCLSASAELPWIHAVNQAECVLSSAIGSEFENILGSVLQSVL